VSPFGHSAFVAQSWKPPVQAFWQEAAGAPPVSETQQTVPDPQLAELVHPTVAPWH
jgi:hypothetical protein